MSQIRATCSICLDDARVLKFSCGYFICAKCTNQVFDLATKNESFFPPKCCEQIPVSLARIFLDEEVYDRYQSRAPEFSTKDRIYCSLAHCSAWIPPECIITSGERNTATCPRCEFKVSESTFVNALVLVSCELRSRRAVPSWISTLR